MAEETNELDTLRQQIQLLQIREQERKKYEEEKEQERKKLEEETERRIEQQRKKYEEELKKLEEEKEQQRKKYEEEKEQQRKKYEEEKEQERKLAGIGKLTSLPELGLFQPGSSSTTQGSQIRSKEDSNASPYTYVSAEFALLTKYKSSDFGEITSMIWRSSKNGKLPIWYAEKDIQTHCMHVIEDILHAIGLENKYFTFTEACISGQSQIKPDFTVMQYRGFPVGLVEVKRPDSKNKLDPKSEVSCNQVGNYLYELFNAGVQCPFAILTTYNQWCVCWLKTSNPLASAALKPESLTTLETLDKNLSEGKKITIFYSNVYEWKDRQIIDFIASVILKMTWSPHIPIQFAVAGAGSIKGRRVYRFVADDSKNPSFAIFKQENKISYSFQPKATTFFRLLQYEPGRDGTVFLACTEPKEKESPSLVVVKYRSESECLEEKKLWSDVWGVECPVHKFFYRGQNEYAILMPFCFHGRLLPGIGISFRSPNHWAMDLTCNSIDHLNQAFESSINAEKLKVWLGDPVRCALNAITDMADRGYKHNDVEWRHVALMPTGDTVRPVMIDLSDVIKLESDTDKNEAIRESMMSLVEKLIDNEVHTKINCHGYDMDVMEKRKQPKTD